MSARRVLVEELCGPLLPRPSPVTRRLRSGGLARQCEHINIDLNEYGIDVGGDEALREAVSVAIALEAWGERFRTEKFARGEAGDRRARWQGLPGRPRGPLPPGPERPAADVGRRHVPRLAAGAAQAARHPRRTERSGQIQCPCRARTARFRHRPVPHIARELGGTPSTRDIRAARETLRRVKLWIREGRTFTRESTLTSSEVLRSMQVARDTGYRVILVFVGIDLGGSGQSAGPESSSARRPRHRLGGAGPAFHQILRQRSTRCRHREHGLFRGQRQQPALRRLGGGRSRALCGRLAHALAVAGARRFATSGSRLDAPCRGVGARAAPRAPAPSPAWLTATSRMPRPGGAPRPAGAPRRAQGRWSGRSWRRSTSLPMPCGRRWGE